LQNLFPQKGSLVNAQQKKKDGERKAKEAGRRGGKRKTRGREKSFTQGKTEDLRWSYTQKVNFFGKELCGKLLPSFYRDSRPDFKLSLFRSHVIIAYD